ncbi:MAG: phosphatidate cytidylyltransferase [Micavibrio sp. TMED27]|nr:phosphatidate cytidylyltransferase [Micavibrio sp.]OUT92441.1 MAG: phosphatidate cytidylyltransferase [Micavibrio sp. TMED27]|tara:strand:+ start:255 stop:1190 length:936 start_codon:yes stop_codon:yes gene_type:complete
MELLENPVHLGIGVVIGILIAATAIVFGLNKFHPAGDYKELSARVKSWWVMITVFSIALLSSPIVSVIFFGLISFLAFKEYVSIIPLRKADRRVLFWAYLTIPIQYALVANNQYGLFIVFIPVWVFFLLPFRLILAKQTEGFLKSVSAISWGLMITVFAVSHAAMLMKFPATEAHMAGGAGLILFMAILNQGNDVAQYVWGKMLGKNKIVPEVSPNKTWEGFLGGALTTTIMALLLYSFLTPFSFVFAALMGAMLAVTGFIGDVTFSAMKRDLKIKDAGSLIPGHGGILDRIDSLSLSAPLFFHMVRYFYY